MRISLIIVFGLWRNVFCDSNWCKEHLTCVGALIPPSNLSLKSWCSELFDLNVLSEPLHDLLLIFKMYSLFTIRVSLTRPIFITQPEILLKHWWWATALNQCSPSTDGTPHQADGKGVPAYWCSNDEGPVIYFHIRMLCNLIENLQIVNFPCPSYWQILWTFVVLLE